MGTAAPVTIAFLSAATALLGLGLYILIDSILKLAYAEAPTIQTVELFSRRVWLGWLMIAVLIYKIIRPLVLGRMKLPLATELHDKALISGEILRDGFSDMRNSIAQLMNRAPTRVDGKADDPVAAKMEEELQRLSWVEKGGARLREDGDVLTGEVFVVPRHEQILFDRLQQATDIAHGVDWRVYNVNVVPVRSLEP